MFRFSITYSHHAGYVSNALGCLRMHRACILRQHPPAPAGSVRGPAAAVAGAARGPPGGAARAAAVGGGRGGAAAAPGGRGAGARAGRHAGATTTTAATRTTREPADEIDGKWKPTWIRKYPRAVGQKICREADGEATRNK